MHIELIFFHNLGKVWIIWATDDYVVLYGIERYYLVGGQTNFAGMVVRHYN